MVFLAFRLPRDSLSSSLSKKELRGLSPRANYTDRVIAVVDEVSANFCGLSVTRGQRDGYLRPCSQLYRPEPLFFSSK
jgi:hypothetical protein